MHKPMRSQVQDSGESLRSEIQQANQELRHRLDAALAGGPMGAAAVDCQVIAVLQPTIDRIEGLRRSGALQDRTVIDPALDAEFAQCRELLLAWTAWLSETEMRLLAERERLRAEQRQLEGSSAWVKASSAIC